VTPFLLLAACGLRNVLPSGPVTDPLPREERSVAYLGPPVVPFPVLPFQVFGLRYAIDLVVVTDHPQWEMHEYARIDLGDRSLWIAQDTDRSGVQTIVADLADIEAWVPEVPVPRSAGPLAVDERWDDRRVEVDLSYTNVAGEAVRVSFAATLPKHPPNKRNGNTMGHSKDVVAAVLDLERRVRAQRVDMWIDGVEQKSERLLGLVPFEFLLTQTQGGVAIADFRQTADADGFVLTRPADGEWPTASTERWIATPENGLLREARFDNGVTAFTYWFEEGGLSRAEVHQTGRPDPVFTMTISPPLPDLRRPFEGELTSRFAMDVGEEKGHGCGSIAARWTDPATVEVALRPAAPHWLADRPMTTRIQYADGAATVETVRDPDGAASPEPCP
jgi:hypothetical protein